MNKAGSDGKLPTKEINLSPKLIESFWKRVQKTDGCWEWKGTINKSGYGKISGTIKRGRAVTAHRLSYTIHKGPIPEGLSICHACDNKKCVNPEHLWAGTIQDNNRDFYQKGRHLLIPPHPPIPKKLNVESVGQILSLGSTSRVYDLAKRYGVDPSTIRDILRGDIWKTAHPHINRPIKSPRHANQKIAPESIPVIFKLRNQGVSLSEIGRRFGVDHSTIRDVLAGKSYKKVQAGCFQGFLF